MRISDWSSDVCSSDLQLMQRLPPRGWLAGRAFNIRVGDKLDPQRFREQLIAAGYQSVSEVQAQGEFAVRGALLDLFPMGATDAYRIDLFDDEIETIRTFDPETQRSEEHTSELQSLMRISYAVFCLKKKRKEPTN